MSVLAVKYGRTADRGKVTGGEKTTETLLWENPSTSTARSSLDATLSQSLQNFQKIRVEYAYNTSTDGEFYAVFPVKDANGDYMFPSGSGKQRMCIGLNNASGNPFVRQFYVSSDTLIHFNNAYRVNTSGNTNTNLIPWKIYGINGGYGGGSSGGGSSVPVYTGTYEVTPKANTEQTLQTAGKQLLENVTVHEVPYYETSNISGTTVYIAQEV